MLTTTTHSATNSPAAIINEAMNTESSSTSSTSTSQLPNIAISSRLSPRKRNMFHLRRHMRDVRFTREMEVRMYNLFKQYSPYPPKSIPENDPAYLIARETLIFRSTTILLDKVTRLGRNPELVDVVLHLEQGQLVSRLHAEITAEPDSEDPTKFSRYSIADRSLNGTYVNDRRAPTVSGELYLKKGDVIKFGHVNGANYKPGEYAIGNESDFIFTFEPAYEGMEYIGHTPDGNRIERKGPQAYIHLGAHSLLPHEFDLFSLVPKKEGDLSVIPYGTRINPEQKRVEYIQPHSQLVTKSNEIKQQQQHSTSSSSDQSIIVPTTTIHPGTFGTTSIPIPGVSNPAIIPNMTNFNLLTDLGRISGELQQTQNNLATNNTNNEMLLNIISQYFKTFQQPSNELLCLLQLLQIPQQQTQPNLSYFQQPITSSNTIHNINIALQGNLLRNYIQPNPNESVITALRQIATPYLNGHTSLNTINGINSGSGANVVQALYAALQPPTTTATSIASMASVMAAASAAAVSAANSIPTTSTTFPSTTIPTTLPSSHQHQFTPPDPRQVIERKPHQHHHHHHHQQQQQQQPQQQIVESSPDNIASASSTTSEETTVPARNPASDLLYHDSIITPQRFSHTHSETKPEKISINEKMLANVAKAAAAAAVGAHYRNSGEAIHERKSDQTTSVETTPTTPVAPTLTKKQRKAAHIADHIQETIDFVAKNTTEIPSDTELLNEQAQPHQPQQQQQPLLNESLGKQRKRKKRLSENENGKHKENVLKILDDAVAKMDPDSKPKPTFKIEFHDSSEPSTTISNGISLPSEVIDREQSSSGGSLIVCEATPDDPGLLNGSNIDLLESKKPDELKLLSRRLSGGSTAKVGSKGRKKKSSETESENSEDDGDDILSTYKLSSRQKNNNSNSSAASSETRPRKKSTSVKSRVIRVPRSPIPSYKKGPERLPGHKSNEVARLLYDLEGSYMHVARKGVTKRQRKNTGDDKKHDSDEETDEEEDGESRPSSSHVVPTKRKSTERFSHSPANKSSKDSQERENNISITDHEKVVVSKSTLIAGATAISSDDEGEEETSSLASPIPKVNGNTSESRKAKRSKDSDGKSTPKLPRKNAKKQAVAENEEVDAHSTKSDDSDSDEDEEEPTPKKRKNGINGSGKAKKETKISPIIKEKKKPGRQPKKDQLLLQPKKKPGRKAKDKNTFVEITNNEWERCAFPACRHPRVDTTVNWVQCDDCDQWFHLMCLFGRDDKSLLEDEFHCGCSKEPRATPIAVMA
jgi:hypothetical protein